MTLAPGTKLGPYEIVAPLGAGGMGEVYRARDPRLERSVAIKVLPPHLASSVDVRARFEREAKTVSSLNHPHICVLYDVGRERDTDYLVMELVDGETLADRLEKGALPTAEVLRLGAQIADALDKAHRAGVVHRDLKPGNVMLTRDGAKLMDFGLARAAGIEPPPGGGAESPTIAQPLTAEGTIVGTFQYMAPEQLEGKEADPRADLWALGCMLYEMATGRRPFEGKSQASLISAIMTSEPAPISQLVSMSPPALDRLVAQCLAKNPDDRFQRGHDVRLVLEAIAGGSSAAMVAPGAAAGPGVAAVPYLRRVPVAFVFTAGLLAGLGVGIGVVKRFLPASHTLPPRVHVLTHSGTDQQPSSSPDGKTVAFASTRTGVSSIWLKQLASGDEVALTNGEDTNPRFSPDGSQILFTHSDGDRLSLWRVSVVGGQARRLVDDATEGAWSPDGSQLAISRTPGGADFRGEVWVTTADGSNPRCVHREPTPLRWLSWSPDGRKILAGPVLLGNAAIRFLVISTEGDSAQRIDPGAGLAQTTNPVWLGTGDRIAYAIVEALATSVTGQATRLVEHSLRTGRVRELLSLPSSCDDIAVLGSGQVVLGLSQRSQDLVLLERPGTPAVRERLLTRGGSSDRQPVFSPDGRRLMFSSNRSGNLDLWEMDLATGALVRLTDHPAQDWDPAYMPGGRGILWSSDRGGNFEVWAAASDGSSPRQVSHDGIDAENPNMTPDGQWIVYLSGRPSEGGVWRMRADGSEARPLVGGLSLPDLSSDGRIFAAPEGRVGLTSTTLRAYRVEDGTPLPWAIPLSARAEIAVGRPRWIGTRRLAYVDRDEAGHYGVSVRDVTETSVGLPRPLGGFDSLVPTESFGVSQDGTRLVLSLRSAFKSLAIAENVSGIEVAGRKQRR